MNDNHRIDENLSLEALREALTSSTQNDTTTESSTAQHNEVISQEATNEASTQAVTGNEAKAHTVQATNQVATKAGEAVTKGSDDKFSAFDSLRHGFNTHKVIQKTEYICGLFPRGGITVIAGASGVGKTTFEQKIIHDASIGGDILNGFTHNEPKRKTIIIAGELGEKGLIERAQEYGWHSDIDLVEVVDLLDFEEKGFSFNINEEAGKANIEHLAQTHELDMLFLDSFGMFYSGKETDNDALRAVFHWLNRIARKYNIAIVVIHHSRKRLSNEQQKPLTLDDVIGGNAISRYAHRVIAIEYNANQKANTVTCLKSWGPYFKTFTYCKKQGFYEGAEPYLEINLEPGDIGTSTTNNNKAPSSEAAIQRKEIITILKTKEGHQATIQEIRDILGIQEHQETAKNTLIQNLKRMINNGEIIKPNNKRGLYALPEPEHTNEETESAQPDNEEPTFDFEEEDSE